MKFLPKRTTFTQIYSGISRLEQYIQATRNNLRTHLPEIAANTHENMSKRNRSTITVKSADKNFGIVLMDTDDYIQ